MTNFYIIRWNNRDISFIQSSDLHELKKNLFLKNPNGSYTIQIYKGPIFFTFKTLEFFEHFKNSDELFIEGEEKIYHEEKKKIENSIFSKFYKSNEFSDIKIKIKNEIFPSHKMVLNRFEFFSKKLNQEIIEIESIGLILFEIIFYFLYFENLENYKLKEGEEENIQIWFQIFQKSKEQKISKKLCELCEIEMIKIYENSSEMSLILEYKPNKDILNSNSEEDLLIEISKFEEKKKKFSKSIPMRIKKLVPLLNQAYKIDAFKFINFVLNELKQHQKISISGLGLNENLIKQINKLKEEIVWNSNSISILKKQYPKCFILNNEMEIPESFEMWKRISKISFPIFTNTIEQKNLKLKKIDLMIRKSISEDESDFKHEKFEVDIPPFDFHLTNKNENKFLY